MQEAFTTKRYPVSKMGTNLGSWPSPPLNSGFAIVFEALAEAVEAPAERGAH
jgi:hypothetical protein